MNAIPERGIFVPALVERSAVREAVVKPSRVLDRFFKGKGVRIVNLSSGGFSAEGAGSLRKGDIIWINLPGLGLLRSQVRWRVEDRFGAAFMNDGGLRVRFLNGLPGAKRR
jgi:hypothetical protein